MRIRITIYWFIIHINKTVLLIAVPFPEVEKQYSLPIKLI